MKTPRIRIPVALLLAGSFAVALAAGGSASAAPEAQFVSLGAQQFAPAFTLEGQSAFFSNLAQGEHQITSVETDAEGRPLFWSSVLGTGELRSRVHGVERLKARPEPYAFYCSYHRTMTGTLVVAGPDSTI